MHNAFDLGVCHLCSIVNMNWFPCWLGTSICKSSDTNDAIILMQPINLSKFPKYGPYLTAAETYIVYFSFGILVARISTKYPRKDLEAKTNLTKAKMLMMDAEEIKRSFFRYMKTARSIPLPNPWVSERTMMNMVFDLMKRGLFTFAIRIMKHSNTNKRSIYRYL